MRFLSVGLVVVVSALSAFGQCTKDTDCKGDRICSNGVCVDAESARRAAATAEEQVLAKYELGDFAGARDLARRLGAIALSDDIEKFSRMYALSSEVVSASEIELAIARLESALELDARITSRKPYTQAIKKRLSRAWQTRGEAEIASNSTQAARESLRKAVEIDENNVEASSRLAGLGRSVFAPRQGTYVPEPEFVPPAPKKIRKRRLGLAVLGAIMLGVGYLGAVVDGAAQGAQYNFMIAKNAEMTGYYGADFNCYAAGAFNYIPLFGPWASVAYKSQTQYDSERNTSSPWNRRVNCSARGEIGALMALHVVEGLLQDVGVPLFVIGLVSKYEVPAIKVSLAPAPTGSLGMGLSLAF